MLSQRAGTERRSAPLWRALATVVAASLAWLVPVAAIAQGTAPAPATRATAARIGYIDMKRLLDNSPQILAGREALTAEFAERDQALVAQEARLADMRAALARDGAILPPDVAQAKTTEIDTLDRNIKRLRDRLRDELNTRRNEELNRAWARIQDTVIEYARARGYDLVVQSPVIYASATIDITDDVLEALRRDARAGGTPP